MKRQEAVESALVHLRGRGCNCNVETITSPRVSEDGETLFWYVEAMHDSWCAAFDKVTNPEPELIPRDPEEPQ